MNALPPAPISAAHMHIALNAADVAMQAFTLALAASPDAPQRQPSRRPRLRVGDRQQPLVVDAARRHRRRVPRDRRQLGAAARPAARATASTSAATSSAPRLEGRVPRPRGPRVVVPAAVQRTPRPHAALRARACTGPAAATTCEFRPARDRRDDRDDVRHAAVPARSPGWPAVLPARPTSSSCTAPTAPSSRSGANESGIQVGADDWFEMRLPNGGGYGDPLDRDPAAVARRRRGRALLRRRRARRSTAWSRSAATVDADGDATPDEPSCARHGSPLRNRRRGPLPTRRTSAVDGDGRARCTRVWCSGVPSRTRRRAARRSRSRPTTGPTAARCSSSTSVPPVPTLSRAPTWTRTPGEHYTLRWPSTARPARSTPFPHVGGMHDEPDVPSDLGRWSPGDPARPLDPARPRRAPRPRAAADRAAGGWLRLARRRQPADPQRPERHVRPSGEGARRLVLGGGRHSVAGHRRRRAASPRAGPGRPRRRGPLPAGVHLSVHREHRRP